MSVNRHKGILNRAAMTISVPESTLRRKIQKIEEQYGSTNPGRPENWPIDEGFYDEIMRVAESNNATPLGQLTELLIAEIDARELSKNSGAQLMGVSLPTYRRLLD